MRKYIRTIRDLAYLIIFAAAVMWHTPASAETSAPMLRKQWSSGAKLTAQPINVACVNPVTTDNPTCASFELQNKGGANWAANIFYTKSTATRVDVRVDCSIDGAPYWAELQGGGVTSLPDVKMGPHGPWWDTSAMTGVSGWHIVFDDNCPVLRVRIYATGGSVGDVVSVDVFRSGL